MDTEVLKDQKKVLSNDKLVVEGKELMPNELNAKYYPHIYDVERIDWDNYMHQIHQTNPVHEKDKMCIGYSAKIQSVSQAKLSLDRVAANQVSNPSLHLTYSYKIRKPISHKGAFVEYIVMIIGNGVQDVICYKHLEKKQPMTAFSSLLDG